MGEVHVVEDVVEGGFRLDHPEFGQVPGRVRVLGAERRAERVDLAHAAGVGLAFELPADGEIRGPVEEIEMVIDFRAFAGEFVERERGDLEHRARPFAIAGGDDRRVQVQKAFFLEILMDRIADAVPHPGDRAEGVRPRPEMGDGPQELERMAFLLQRIRFGVGDAIDEDVFGEHFGRLSLARRGADFALDANARADGELFDFRLVVRQRGLGDDLNVAEAGAVVQFDEAEPAFRVPPGADPTLNNDILADRFGLAGSGDGDF